MEIPTLAPPPLPDAAPDRDASRRPGVPKEREPSRLPNARFPITQQQRNVEVLVKAGRPITPVFSTAVPPRGLSGAIRRAAYAAPGWHMRHWTLLLLADRVDSFEHRLRKLAPFAVPAAALGVVVLARRRRRR